MAAISAAVGAVLALALLMTLATRLKAGRWWRNTLIFRAGRALFRLLRRAGHGLGKLTELLPCTWRTTLWVAGVLFLQFFLALLGLSDGAWLIPLVFLDLALLSAAVLYAWQMKQLFRAGAALAAGDLEAKVDTRRMFPPLAAHGGHLNAIGDGMNAAVEQRMRSEHFKTELITNVSHDLKTPLTSIINYVDLLKKEEITNETARGYVEVLDRKSQRLKKLTEDLIEASKASTGALTVTPERIDFNQLLEQALGEYEDRLLALDLHPMLLLAAPPVHALADGRHLWRVIDNLLSNCCKYTMPGTRVYVEAARREGLAVLSVKNISREPLNISADALMERFVRGDAARTTEGSGLGLSIARSLTEIQGGTFAVSIDGDLFKATVTFPEAP
jgi:signal transduction histidine kinase